MHFDWFFAHDLWKNRRMDDVTSNNVAFLTYKMTRFHVCTVIDHRISKNVGRTSVTHSAALHMPHLSYLIYLIIFWSQTWNLVVK